MHTITRLTFAKKLTLPSKAANVLQSLNMAYAFAENGVPTNFYPGFKGDRTALRTTTEKGYALNPTPDLNLRSLYGNHKGVYGLSFRAMLAMAWLRSKPTDVFYTRDIKEARFLAGLKRTTGLKRPLFFEMHEILSEQHASYKTGKAEQFFSYEKEILAQVNGIVSISTLLADDIKRVHTPDVPIHIAPMGFNPHLYRPIEPVDLSGDITMAYAGSLYEGKGIHNLLRSLAHLPERFKLVVMGGNPQSELDVLKDMAKDFPGRVEFTGQLTPVSVSEKLRSCQIFVIPQSTGTEFFSPIKLYEAMGMALPTVTTPVPTIAAAVTHGKDAFLAEGIEPQELAKAVEHLANNETMVHAMQQHAIDHSSHFTWQHRAKLCLDFMSENMN